MARAQPVPEVSPGAQQHRRRADRADPDGDVGQVERGGIPRDVNPVDHRAAAQAR
jgi:hypothetical protein